MSKRRSTIFRFNTNTKQTRHMKYGSYPREFKKLMGARTTRKKRNSSYRRFGNTPNGGFCRGGGSDKSSRKILLIHPDDGGNKKITLILSSRYYSHKHKQKFYKEFIEKDLKDHKRYRDLLSRGWKVIATWDYLYDPKDSYKKGWKNLPKR